jgi:hypothetical protein
MNAAAIAVLLDALAKTIGPRSASPVEAVGGGRLEVVVDRRQRLSVRRAVGKAARAGPGRGDDQVRRRRQISVQPRADLDVLGVAALDLGEAPHRHPPPIVWSREEVPVRHRVAEYRVGDVVRRQPETVDAQ